MTRMKFILLQLLLFSFSLFSQDLYTKKDVKDINFDELFSIIPTNASITTPIDYSIIVYDGTLDSFTMKQFNRNTAALSNFLERGIDSIFFRVSAEERIISFFIKPVIPFFTTVFTHEEAHRSILTNLGIGSISQPFFNKEGAAYVKGVTNSTLVQLRQSDLPMYIRLHTAGIESNYCNNLYYSELMTFKKFTIPNVYVDFLYHTFSAFAYLQDGLNKIIMPKLDKEISRSEEENELDRDIVGHDVYGMVRHLFRPDMDFKRYTGFGELTDEEKKFITRIGLRANLLLLNTNFIFVNSIKLPGKISFNASAGYCIAPFGDFIDENIFFKYDKFNISFYARQAQNRHTWFPGFGLGLVEYKPVEWFSTTVRGHFWMQPENLDFNTTLSTPGGAGEVSLNFVLPNKNEGAVKGMGVTIGALYKTKGFMPEIERHDAHFRMSAGLVVRY